jgi:hypothetical protein
VGRSAWNFGSYHLWGDVPALMPIPSRIQKFNPDGTGHPPGSWFAVADSKNRGSGSWFNIAHNTVSGVGQNPDGRKVPGFRFDGSGRSFQSESVKVSGDWFGSYEEMKQNGTISPGRLHGKNSVKRKAASAQIAKIPFPLARHIARSFHP